MHEEEQPAGAKELDLESLSSKEIAKLQAQHEKKKPSSPKQKLTPIHKRKEKPFQEGGELATPKVR